MKLATKKIIAREGLILLAVAGYTLIWFLIMGVFVEAYLSETEGFIYWFLAIITAVVPFGYIFYVVIYRLIWGFIKWAIKTLKEKDE